MTRRIGETGLLRRRSWPFSGAWTTDIGIMTNIDVRGEAVQSKYDQYVYHLTENAIITDLCPLGLETLISIFIQYSMKLEYR